MHATLSSSKIPALGLPRRVGETANTPVLTLQDLFELSLAQARQGNFPPYFATRVLCALSRLRLAPPRQVLKELLQVRWRWVSVRPFCKPLA